MARGRPVRQFLIKLRSYPAAAVAPHGSGMEGYFQGPPFPQKGRAFVSQLSIGARAQDGSRHFQSLPVYSRSLVLAPKAILITLALHTRDHVLSVFENSFAIEHRVGSIEFGEPIGCNEIRLSGRCGVAAERNAAHRRGEESDNRPPCRCGDASKGRQMRAQEKRLLRFLTRRRLREIAYCQHRTAKTNRRDRTTRNCLVGI